jgi:hypothetical protein
LQRKTASPLGATLSRFASATNSKGTIAKPTVARKARTGIADVPDSKKPSKENQRRKKVPDVLGLMFYLQAFR